MPLPVFTPAPPAPDRINPIPTTFTIDAFAFLDWMATIPDQFADYSAALIAIVSGIDFNGTSATSLAIGTGSKAFTTQAGKLWQIGQFVIAASAADPTNFMSGQVLSYAGTTLTISVPPGGTGGSGTFADWAIGTAPVAAQYMPIFGGTFTDKATTATPAAAQEALIIPHGAAPTVPTDGSIWTTTAGLFARINGATRQFLTLAGDTLTGLLVTMASTAGGAFFRLPHGAAPTAPTNGDVWTTSGGFFARINGVTVQLFPQAGGALTGVLTTATPAAGQEALIIPAGADPSAPTNGGIWFKTAGFFVRVGGATRQLISTVAGVLDEVLVAKASDTNAASIRLPHGTAPTTPTNGDFWSTTAAFFARISGTTRQLATTDGAETFTNKRINVRDSSTTSAASITPDISSFDQYTLTAQAAGLTVNAPTGTPTNGQKLMFRFKDNGTTRTITWNAIFRALGATLPTSTTISKTIYVGCIYNSTDTKWDVVAVNIEA